MWRLLPERQELPPKWVYRSQAVEVDVAATRRADQGDHSEEAFRVLCQVQPLGRKEVLRVAEHQGHPADTLALRDPFEVLHALNRTAGDHRDASFQAASWDRKEVPVAEMVAALPWGSSSGCCGSCSCRRENLDAVESEASYRHGMALGRNLVLRDRLDVEAFQEAENVDLQRTIHRNRRNV